MEIIMAPKLGDPQPHSSLSWTEASLPESQVRKKWGKSNGHVQNAREVSLKTVSKSGVAQA